MNLAMCNLYSLARSRDEVNHWFRINRDLSDNPPLPGIFPDQIAPVIRMDADGARVMQPMRLGFPPPPKRKPPPSATLARRLPSTGLDLVNVRPLAASTSLPPMNARPLRSRAGANAGAAQAQGTTACRR